MLYSMGLFKAIAQKRTCLMKKKYLSRLRRKIEIGAKLVPKALSYLYPCAPNI